MKLPWLGLALLTCACGSRRLYLPDPGPYDALDAEAVARLRPARYFLEQGQPEVALYQLRAAARRHPLNLPVARLALALML